MRYTRPNQPQPPRSDDVQSPGEVRHELILRMPNLTSTQVDAVEQAFVKAARQLPGAKLSRVARTHLPDGSVFNVHQRTLVETDASVAAREAWMQQLREAHQAASNPREDP